MQIPVHYLDQKSAEKIMHNRTSILFFVIDIPGHNLFATV